MIKKVLAIVCASVLLTATFAGCGCQKEDGDTTPTETAVTPTVADPEGARVSTLDKFLTNSRSFTIDEKVLRFYLDNAQMEYIGFTLTDPTALEAIEPGEKVENVEYTSENGLTAYINAKNRSDEVADYTRTNSVKYYSIRLVKGDSDAQLHLPNKMGWDNTIDEYKDSYGKPLSETTDENGNTVIVYGEDVAEISEGYTMSLVFSDKGLTEFTIELHDVTA